MNFDKICLQVREKGGRLTKIRLAILKIFCHKTCFLSQAQILVELNKQKIIPNRSTIFRELNFLVKNNFLLKNNVGGEDLYELVLDHHHHHLVCVKCHKIERIDMKNHLKTEEKKLEKKKDFSIISHALDFYGYCKKCNK